MLAIYDGSKIVEHITLWPLVAGWQEAGSVWVRPEYRGRSIAKQLFGAILTEHSSEKILLTTTNPVIMRLSEFVGLRLVHLAQLPHKVHCATCVCSIKKMQADHFQDCRLKDKECKLLVN